MTHYNFYARCRYKDKKDFYFISNMFRCSFSDLERLAVKQVVEEWSLVSPHDPPDIIEVLAGTAVVSIIEYKDYK